MTEFTALHVALLVGVALIGSAAGWVLRGRRAEREKAAVSRGWQDQLDAQRSEHKRLSEQNKGLMEQVSQLQASNRDAKNRARELSGAVREAFERRDELQRELKNIRTSLETTLSERDRLQSSAAERVGSEAQLEVRDARIARLEADLRSWQDRLPPLIERYRERDAEVERLSVELADAHARVRELEALLEHGETRVEPMDTPGPLTDGLIASNDTLQAVQPFASEPSGVPLNGRRDNLKQIKGVGPAIEKTLNELGIFSLRQIAQLSEYDIDRIASRLRGFRSRIYREDWVGQARALCDRRGSH